MSKPASKTQAIHQCSAHAAILVETPEGRSWIANPSGTPIASTPDSCADLTDDASRCCVHTVGPSGPEPATSE